MFRRNFATLALVGAALAIVVVGFALAAAFSHRQGAPAASRSRAAPAAALTARQIYQRYERGVVEIIDVSPVGGGSARLVDSGPGARGLGFVVSGGGLILTSAQLVDHNGRIVKTVNVVFQVGATQTKRVVGAIVCVDAAHDLAVVRVDPAQVGGLVALPMGDSSALRPGQAVVALGDPLTSPWSFATATVSATRRDVVATSGASMEAAMLTDASLGSGESGGPLIDMSGRGVAVIDRVGATAGDPRSAGSAVPINLAAHVIADSLGR